MLTLDRLNLFVSTFAYFVHATTAQIMAATERSSSQRREKVYHELSVKHNSTSILFVRASVSTVAGCAAGILGLSGLCGFAFYALVSAITGALLYFVKAKGEPSRYFKGWENIWTDEVLGNLLSYVLFWTLG